MKYNSDIAYAGVGWFKLPNTHPFNPAAYNHDAAYYVHPAQSTKHIDRLFYLECLDAIPEKPVLMRVSLRAQALTYYKFCRIWGIARVINARLRGQSMLLKKPRDRSS